jgi:hypothetical protein
MNHRISLIALLAFSLASAVRADKNETKDDSPASDSGRAVQEECLTIRRVGADNEAVTSYVCRDYTLMLKGNYLYVIGKGYAAMAADAVSGQRTSLMPGGGTALTPERKALFERDPATFARTIDVGSVSDSEHEFIIAPSGMNRDRRE